MLSEDVWSLAKSGNTSATYMLLERETLLKQCVLQMVQKQQQGLFEGGVSSLRASNCVATI